MSANTTTLTPEQREAIYEAWIAALRSGQYKQGRYYLELDGKFCCLGVLCHVLHQDQELGIEMDRFVIPDAATTYSTPTRPGCRSHVPDSIADELGLLTTMPSAAPRVVESALRDLNDVDGASFTEIAQFIEGSVMPLLRTKGILPPAQQEAPEGTITLEQAEGHAHICSKLAEEHKDDALLFAAHMPPSIPIDVAIWSAADCAAYMRISESSFYQRIACLPHFPHVIRIKNAEGRATHPRWKALEVIEWAEKYQERRAE